MLLSYRGLITLVKNCSGRVEWSHMELYGQVAVFILGTIIGSFLNVVIYRLHTGRSLNGHSHCMSCGKHLRWYELFPLLSYVALRGRCAGCGSYIPSRYALVELLTGVLYLLVWRTFFFEPVLILLNWVFLSVLMIIAVYDMRHTIIPDEMTILAGIVALIYAGYASFIAETWMPLLSEIGAGLAAFVFFGGLWYVSGGRWIGFGDAKLAVPLGIMVGLGGVFSMIVLSFWIGAVISLVLLGLGKLVAGKTGLRFLSAPITIKSEIPFAPFLILGFLLVHITYADIFTIVYHLLY